MKTTVGQLSEATFKTKRGVNRPLTKTNDAPGLTLLGEVARLFLAAFIAIANGASQAFMDHGPFQIYANSFV